MLLIKINEQLARKYNDQIIVSDAVNFIPIQFEFDDSWNGLNLTYQFTNGTTTIDLATNKLIINIPKEVLISGVLYVKVYGTLLDETGLVINKRATMNPIPYIVIASTLGQANNAQPVTPELYDQIYSLAQAADIKVTKIELETSNLVNLKSEMESSVLSAVASETNAKTSEDNSKLSETNADTSKLAAKASEDNSKVSETSAAESATTAIEKAQIATDKATEASVYATQAQETFETVYNNTASISSTAPTDKKFWLDLNIE